MILNMNKVYQEDRVPDMLPKSKSSYIHRGFRINKEGSRESLGIMKDLGQKYDVNTIVKKSTNRSDSIKTRSFY